MLYQVFPEYARLSLAKHILWHISTDLGFSLLANTEIPVQLTFYVLCIPHFQITQSELKICSFCKVSLQLVTLNGIGDN